MHIPVLKEEVLHFLNPRPNEDFIDCTAGAGGHARSILEKNAPQGRVMAMEWDKELAEHLQKQNIERMKVVNESYTLLEETARKNEFFPVSGVLFDLGFSSYHIEQSGRGFSFQRDEPLDMRYNSDNSLTAKEIVNRCNKKSLIYILKKWGEEEHAPRIAREIIKERNKKEISTTAELVKIVERIVPDLYKKKKIHFATKTFQALRIAVNGEILALRAALPQAVEVMKKGGVLAVITFHGGEEQAVKSFFKKHKEVKLFASCPVTPSLKEQKENIRSRSAKLFAAEKQ